MEKEFAHQESITLPCFIRNEQGRHVETTGRLTNVLLSIALGSKIVSRGVNRAGMSQLLGLAGKENVQGELVQKLDVFADHVFSEILGECGEFISMVSEEQEDLFPAAEGHANSRYVIAFDPLDGSSNIDVNVSIGTIWGIYNRKTGGEEVDPQDTKDFRQQGRKQIAAGYVIYGSSTMFVFTTGNGVHGFTLDPTIGEFILTHPHMKMPKSGNLYSCNESNIENWDYGLQKYIGTLKSGETQSGKCSMRYVGSLVADFHRTLIKGGIFLYPADQKYKTGKLRLLYECAPLAMIVEQAGGVAIDGQQKILDIKPTSIHQRVPFITGSPLMVEDLQKCLEENSLTKKAV
jgi:fructose-1,6-bisphosphatase I